MSYPSVANTFQNNVQIINPTDCNTNFANIISGVVDGAHDLNVNNFTINGTSSVVSGTVSAMSYAEFFPSSVVQGWASGVSGTINYKRTGKNILLNYYITGTSTGRTATFTLPYDYNASTVFTNVVPYASYFGGYSSGAVQYTSGVNYYAQAVLSTSNKVAVDPVPNLGWSGIQLNSGTKTIHGVLVYEAI